MGPCGSLNILLVEDHPDTAAALKGYLERSGHEVATAATCQEALASPGLARAEVLICNLNLPDGSGWELLPALRARMGPAYAVAVTAQRRPDDEARSRRVGFQAYLAKPFSPQQLAELLAAARGKAAGGAPKRGGQPVKPLSAGATPLGK
jgi:CheY-like chemotaxis protein